MTPEEQRAYDEWYASVRARVEAGDVRGALQDVPRIAGLEPAAPRPLRRPLSESTVALVTSAGISAPGQPPMDGLNFEGDYTIRVLDIDQPSAGLVISHTHFETGPAEEDINIVYPIDRLKELAADGVIGRVAPQAVSFMGYFSNAFRIRDEVAPAVVDTLRSAGVDAAVLVPV